MNNRDQPTEQTRASSFSQSKPTVHQHHNPRGVNLWCREECIPIAKSDCHWRIYIKVAGTGFRWDGCHACWSAISRAGRYRKHAWSLRTNDRRSCEKHRANHGHWRCSKIWEGTWPADWRMGPSTTIVCPLTMSLEQALLRYSPFWFVYHFFDKVIGKSVCWSLDGDKLIWWSFWGLLDHQMVLFMQIFW